MKRPDLVAYPENGNLVIDQEQDEYLRWYRESADGFVSWCADNVPIERITSFVENYDQTQLEKGKGLMRLFDSPEGFWEISSSRLLAVIQQRLESIEFFSIHYPAMDITWIHPSSSLGDKSLKDGSATITMHEADERVWDSLVDANARRVIGYQAIATVRRLPSYIRYAK